MPASLCRFIPAARHVAGLALLAVLAGCQHYAPNSAPDRDSTEAQTRAEMQRLQERSANRTMAPSQIRIATGGITQPDGALCRDWLDACWERGAGAAPAAASTPGLARLPRPDGAQTFRGVLPCDDVAMGCRGQRVTLTLFENETFRGHVVYLNNDGSESQPAALQGCWARDAGEGRHLQLTLGNGASLGHYLAESVNTLVVLPPDDRPGNLRVTLTRQPDAELMGGMPPAGRCRT